MNHGEEQVLFDGKHGDIPDDGLMELSFNTSNIVSSEKHFIFVEVKYAELFVDENQKIRANYLVAARAEQSLRNHEELAEIQSAIFSMSDEEEEKVDVIQDKLRRK